MTNEKHFPKTISNESLIMACLQIYWELLSHVTFDRLQKSYPTSLDKIHVLTCFAFKVCSSDLQAHSYQSLSLFLYLFISFFILQPSVKDLVYVFLIFFRFHRCFNNFHLTKNIFINNFFYWNMCFFRVLPP